MSQFMLYNYLDFARDSRHVLGLWICHQTCCSRAKREFFFEVHLWLLICDGFGVFFMSKRSWQSHHFSVTASSADGKDTASVRHLLYKYSDGATRWELQRLTIGHVNDCLDRAWRPCQVIKENKLTWEVFCLALGLDLQSMVEKSRAMVRVTSR